MDSSSDDDNDDLYTGSRDDEPILDEERYKCLFCKDDLVGAGQFLSHLTNIHSFDLPAFCKSNTLEFYEYIKLVNYIRKNGVSTQYLRTFQRDILADESLLSPCIANDPVLQMDMESLLPESLHQEAAVIPPVLADDSTHNPSQRVQCLEAKITAIENRANQTEEFLRRALDDLNSCRAEMQRQILHTSSESLPRSGSRDDDENASLHPSNSYFGSYSHHGIHEEMLKDVVRTEAYRDYIVTNKKVFEDKVVLDIGCGTGILSMFASKMGCRLVLGVDQSDIAYQAMANVQENGIENVTIVKGSAETVLLPDDNKIVDVIISEWMGYFLLFEGMLDTVIRCRDRLGGPNTVICPDICTMHLVALSDATTQQNKLDYWNNVYGFKMNAMRPSVLSEPLIMSVDPGVVISSHVEIKKLDLNTVSVADLDFASEFVVEILKDGLCTSFCGYFDTIFSHGNALTFSTSPCARSTHWKQTVFLLAHPVEVHCGQQLRGNISCNKSPINPRDLDVVLELFHDDSTLMQRQSYCLC